MCGLAGLIINNPDVDSFAILKRMANALAHRGPDGQGFFKSITRNNKYRISLAHKRLSIIDLEGGHQPMENEDGSIQVVFNGEIYNFKNLRSDLINLGHRFKTNSDTETIVHAYEEYGLHFVNHLRGMFAIAIWDSKTENLILARDRFGQKPLFFCETNGNLFFASEIKSILTCPGVEVSVDKNSVYQYLSYRYVPGPKTLFSKIHKLPPASVAVWEKGNLSQKSYFSPPDKFTMSRNMTIPSENPVRTFLASLDKSVDLRMISDVPFGAFLSGGIDSSAIVALMSRHSDLPIKTFSVGFREKQYNELRHARSVAEKFKTDHHELIISQKNIIDEIEKLTWYRDAPITEPSDIPIYLLAKEASKSVKMVLTGEGSDEILGGYPKHVFERYTCLYQCIPRIVHDRLIEPLIISLPYGFRRAKTAIVNLGIQSKQERFPSWFGALNTKERSRLTRLESPFHGKTKEFQFKTDPSNSSLRQILYFDQTSWLPDNLLERGDRMTMAASIEARMPFMDHELANYVSGLPDHYRVKGHQTKWILRKALKNILPHNIITRPKIGFRVPVNQWFQLQMKDYLLDHLSSKNAVTSEYYHQPVLTKIINDHIQGRQNHEKLLWTLLSLEIWHRQFNISL